jgi:hypothetical protein
MTVQVADAYAHVQMLVSVVKMATVLEEFINEEQRSVVRFSRKKGLNAKDIHREIFPFYDGKCWSPKAVHIAGSGISLKDLRKSQMMKRRWGSG